MKSMKKITSVFTLILMILFSAGIQAQEKDDIVDVATETDKLSTLVTAVKAADLVETLKADGPYTVFAPTNEAFEELPEGVLDMLLKPENKEKLVAVLTYHVVPGEVMSQDITKNMQAMTVEGSKAWVKVKGEKVMVDDAKVIMPDVDASNGVVHVIDEVILPPSIEKELSKKAGK